MPHTAGHGFKSVWEYTDIHLIPDHLSNVLCYNDPHQQIHNKITQLEFIKYVIATIEIKGLNLLKYCLNYIATVFLDKSKEQLADTNKIGVCCVRYITD